MARPRLPVNYALVYALAAEGLGTRKIAPLVGRSRSVVQRIVTGRRPEEGPLPRCDGCEARRTKRQGARSATPGRESARAAGADRRLDATPVDREAAQPAPAQSEVDTSRDTGPDATPEAER